MNSPVMCQPTLRVNSDPSQHGSGSVSACCLGADLVAFLRSCTRPGDLLKSIFRVTVAQVPSPERDSLPDVSGRYLLFEDEVQFIPHFPFEKDVKYRASFDPRPLGAPLTAEPLMLEFLIPAKQTAPALTEVTHIFPSCDLLPGNLLRFYVCFSDSMQRGRALEEISLLDSDGQPVADALYRPPVELWDRTMRHLTVLLDPGRLKRWLGPNVELGPPLKAGQEYTLEIGSGMIDLHGRPLREHFRKHFLVGDAVRKHISVEHWKILPPVTGSRQALVLIFTSPLDWALLLQTITIGSADGSVIDGRVVVDECERRWSFTPTLPWAAGVYHIRVGSSLEDVCGNSITGAFDRPLRKSPNPVTEINCSSLILPITLKSNRPSSRTYLNSSKHWRLKWLKNPKRPSERSCSLSGTQRS
jgi:hypothetical protein